MNSLSYLSRQFDVLASPRTPPSTPTSESATLSFDGQLQTRLKRSGSTRSFLVPQPSSSSGGWTLKRSYSSPAEVNPTTPSPPSSSSSPPLAPSISRKPSKPSLRRASVSATEKAIRPKGTSDDALVRHLVFVRIILQLWHAFLAALRTLTGQAPTAPYTAVPVDDIAVDDNSDEEEKDTEDESRDEKPPLPAPPSSLSVSVLLDSQPPPPYQPAISSPLSQPQPASPSEKDQPTPIPPNPDSRQPSLFVSTASSTLTPPPSNTARSRSITPTPPSKQAQTPFHQPKTLVLDLDETLIHSTSRPLPYAGGSGLFGFGSRNKGAGYTVEVVLGGRSTLYHVYKRPFVDYFLRKVSQWYTLVIFTASMQEYADPVIDWLDAGRGILGRRLFRESCTQLPNGSYTKDLSIVEQDLSRVCLIDNSPVCYSHNEANGIPIEGWTHDPHDEALLDLLPVLDSLRFTRDVRSVLGIRGFS
ncbi:NIF-domain-containing protein [Trametes coccinea BRFM310]|uniref:NIF-domain-containing protein n=1 Tax=Trametes coccinea (strain BRFM310) TaxID=1353009 RepID=A0A1Y2IF63_TRAC3|nr:NIF-domain-containing protein [Trametes coccinea BRFM310]